MKQHKPVYRVISLVLTLRSLRFLSLCGMLYTVLSIGTLPVLKIKIKYSIKFYKLRIKKNTVNQNLFQDEEQECK